MRWISIEDKKPEDGETVICTQMGCPTYPQEDYKNRIYISDYSGSGVFWSGMQEIGIVTHWMPIPEMPKRDAE